MLIYVNNEEKNFKKILNIVNAMLIYVKNRENKSERHKSKIIISNSSVLPNQYFFSETSTKSG